jgi:DNA-directed RNA polymerase subunit RPC12/RpoP
MKSAQKRALVRLSESLYRFRCVECLSDLRQPKVTLEGVRCCYCGHLDTRRAVVLRKEPLPGGFRWVAELAK